MGGGIESGGKALSLLMLCLLVLVRSARQTLTSVAFAHPVSYFAREYAIANPERSSRMARRQAQKREAVNVLAHRFPATPKERTPCCCTSLSPDARLKMTPSRSIEKLDDSLLRVSTQKCGIAIRCDVLLSLRAIHACRVAQLFSRACCSLEEVCMWLGHLVHLHFHFEGVELFLDLLCKHGR